MSKKYPTMPGITGDIASHTQALGTVREKCDIYERQTNDLMSSFISVKDLVDLNILAVQGGKLVLGSAF